MERAAVVPSYVLDYGVPEFTGIHSTPGDQSSCPWLTQGHVREPQPYTGAVCTWVMAL